MSERTISIDERLHEYMLDVSLRETDILRRLRGETAAMPQHSMQISPEQGQFMALLVRVTSARRIVEVGTFTGYSALVMAQALPADGIIVACDVSEEWTSIARRYWIQAGVADRIDLRLAPATQTLDGLLAEGSSGTFDVVFIDADKESYLEYYERALRLLRPGGLIIVDNVLWGGSVVNPEKQDPDTRAIRTFNSVLATDRRIELSLVPIGDGLTLAYKRA